MATLPATTTTTTSTSLKEKEKKGGGGQKHLHLRISNYESMNIDVIMKRLHLAHRAEAVRYAVREFYKTLLKIQREQKEQQQQQQQKTKK